jgi:hypothetical protein
MFRMPVMLLAILAGIGSCTAWAASGPGGVFEIEVVDSKTREPLACRMHLRNAAGKALKAPRVPFWYDHFTFDGTVSLKLPKGDYDFTIEHGLEYMPQTGRFTMDNFSKDKKTFELDRFADMASEGWWSGELDIARPAIDLPLLMRAEDLHVATLITWPGREVLLPSGYDPARRLVNFDKNRFVHVGAGIDNRGGSTLLLFNLDKPLSLESLDRQLGTLEQMRAQQGWADARDITDWDLPLWIASGKLDSVQVLNSAVRRSPDKKRDHDKPLGKPRDEAIYDGVDGQGRWAEAVYHHLLNCGLRIPPTAGSGSGEFGNPLAFNRMYVHVDGDLTYERWWDGVRSGRVTITNGPLLRPVVEGERPGFVFRAEAGQQVELEMALSFASRDSVAAIEVIKDGEVAHEILMPDFIQAGGVLPTVSFDQSGWLLVRTTASVPGGYRFAMTAPYYVEIGGEPRISKASAEFFLSWTKERAEMTKSAANTTEYQQAIAYWQSLIERANAP